MFTSKKIKLAFLLLLIIFNINPEGFGLFELEADLFDFNINPEGIRIDLKEELDIPGCLFENPLHPTCRDFNTTYTCERISSGKAVFSTMRVPDGLKSEEMKYLFFRGPIESFLGAALQRVTINLKKSRCIKGGLGVLPLLFYWPSIASRASKIKNKLFFCFILTKSKNGALYYKIEFSNEIGCKCSFSLEEFKKYSELEFPSEFFDKIKKKFWTDRGKTFTKGKIFKIRLNRKVIAKRKYIQCQEAAAKKRQKIYELKKATLPTPTDEKIEDSIVGFSADLNEKAETEVVDFYQDDNEVPSFYLTTKPLNNADEGDENNDFWLQQNFQSNVEAAGGFSDFDISNFFKDDL